MSDEPADVEIHAGPNGLGKIYVDGKDVTRFVRGVGFDLEAGEHTRIVLEGAGGLQAMLDQVEIEYRRIPVLSSEEMALLRSAETAFDPESPNRERYRFAIEKLEEVVERRG